MTIYSPSQKRKNLIREVCLKLVREEFPERYAILVSLAKVQIPEGKAGWPKGRPSPQKGKKMKEERDA